jgi:flagellar protein FlaF
MGFSVSGAAAIIFASMFIAFGMWSTATANTVERVNEAEAARTDGLLEQQNTAIAITSATWDGSDLVVDVENTGASQLRLGPTDLLIDGRYETGWEPRASVAGDGGTDLWLTGETATIKVSLDSQPDRVKIVTASGVSATAEVA